MLKHGEVNPLSVHGLRQLSWCPPHFTLVALKGTPSEKTISDWIYENLSGRFYIGINDDLNDEHNRKGYIRHTIVAFEIAGEASYFSLLLPQILPHYQ